MLWKGFLLEGRYRLLEEIGRGGTSVVYLVVDEKLKRRRAVKIVDQKKIPDPEIWKREWEIFQKIRSIHMAQLYDVLEYETHIFFVMEYVDGYTVKELLGTSRHFSLEQTIEYGLQICEILTCLHDQNPPVIYRDLKPSNLMLRSDHSLVLIDFGTARTYAEHKDRDTVFWGTVGYASPEQTEGIAQTDARSDLYSVGVILYEMHYGVKFSRDALRKPESALEEIVEKCTRRNPKERYQTALSLAEDLKNYQLLGRKNRQRHMFRAGFRIVIWTATLFLFFLSALLRQQANRLVVEGYERYLKAGEAVTEDALRVDYLREAILLNPWKEEAYLALLREFCDQGFSQKHYERMLSILDQENGGQTCEECLRQSPDAYGRFAMQLGIACYFEWEGYGNKKYARPWLEIAEHSEGISDAEKKMAVILRKIAEYYDLLEQPTEEQMERISYSQYWEDLQELETLSAAAGLTKLAEKEMISQILRYVQEFQKAQVPEAELLDTLQKIRETSPDLAETVRAGEQLVELIYGDPS